MDSKDYSKKSIGLEVVAVLISIIALIASVRSCNVSHDALQREIEMEKSRLVAEFFGGTINRHYPNYYFAIAKEEDVVHLNMDYIYPIFLTNMSTLPVPVTECRLIVPDEVIQTAFIRGYLNESLQPIYLPLNINPRTSLMIYINLMVPVDDEVARLLLRTYVEFQTAGHLSINDNEINALLEQNGLSMHKGDFHTYIIEFWQAGEKVCDTEVLY